MNVDLEIYIKKVITFFEENPNSLIELIGNLNKDVFYEEIKTVVINNFNEKNEGELTKQQLIDIVIKLSGAVPRKLNLKFIQETSIGTFFLN